ncbi:TonB-dependent receptor [Erythrobacter sp. GH1-10]|uniref:TonB-dependent receptor n=1 Tax=Erythrobacter sp. GH1-10 TaxID=3349334 RepID=UPI0038779229
MRNIRKSLLGSSAFAVMAAVGASPALAQDQEQESGNQPPSTVTGQSEIVVEGRRGSAIESIDEKRNADSVIDVLSADQAGRFPDPNVAEALARIPGIGFQRENDTGDGEFISIRGLDASYNTVLYDGIRTGTADEFRRTALDIVTANGVSLIEVIKAPLPEHATEGIGGVVNIRTRGALERREGAFLEADIRDNTFVDDYGYRFAGGFTKQITDNLAFNISGAYRKLYLDTLYVNPASFTLEQLNAITIDGNTFIEEGPLEKVPQGFLDPNDFTNEQINFEDNLIERDNYSLAGTVQWQASDTTIFTLGGRWTRDDTTQTTSNVEFDADNGDIEPDGMGGFLPSEFPDPEITFEGQIEDSKEIQERYFFRGETTTGNWTFDYVAGYSRAFEDEPILSIDFTNDFDDVPGGRNDNAVTFVPLDFSNPPFAAPLPKDLGVFQRALDPFCRDDDGDPCGEINDFDESIIDSRENKRWVARFDTTYEFDGGSAIEYIKAGVQYERSEYEQFEFDISDVDDQLGPNGEYLGDDREVSLPDNNTAMGELGLIDGSLSTYDRIGNPFSDIGLNGVVLFDPTRLREIRQTFRDGFFASGLDPRSTTLLTAEEDFYTGYAQAKLRFGDLSIVGGARIEQYEANFSAPQTFDARVFFDTGNGGDVVELATPGGVQNVTETDNFEVLPRIAFNYDLTPEIKLRASYTTSIARPTFDLLAAEVDGNFSIELADGVSIEDATPADIRNVEIDFDLGNPALKNAFSQNFDLSFEFYANRDNAFTVAAFYKTIDDFIFNSFAIEGAISGVPQFDPISAVANAPFSDDGRALLDQLGGIDAILSTPGAQVDIRQPSNGNRAEVYGVEIGVFHSLTYLPGLLGNLSFSGNLTLQETSIDLDLGVFEADDALVVLGIANAGDTFTDTFDLFNSPKVTGNAALNYSDRNWDATVAYRYQGRQLEEVGTFGLSQFQQGRGFLDLDIEYSFRDIPGVNRATMFFSANDLLDGGRRPTTYETRGPDEQFPDFASFNGRTFRAGVRVSF